MDLSSPTYKQMSKTYISEPCLKHSLSYPRIVYLPLLYIKIESLVRSGFIHSEINKLKSLNTSI